jgi:uncharacterized protein DUF4157
MNRLSNLARPCFLQRKCSCGGTSGSSGECEECRKNRLSLQRRPPANREAAVGSSAPPIVNQVLSSPGRPLDSATRAFMEPRFGYNFSNIRVHTDATASESARAVDALAYTVGRNIVFRESQFRPETTDGRTLLAHELTHAVQQSATPFHGGIDRSKIAVEPAGGAFEDAAEKRAHEVVTRGVSAPSAGTANYSLMRQAAPAHYGPACSHGAQNPCQLARCDANQNAIVTGDLALAINYIDAATAALGATPLASDTATALDWFFNSHDAATANEVQRRLGCIRTCLTDTQANNRHGCDLDDTANLAYVCMGRTPICVDAQTDVCVTKQHFGAKPRVRAETVIHECAHRVGMSLGKKKRSVPDIYEWTPRFLNLSTDDALQNSDSFARFAGAITNGIGVTGVKVLSVSGGTVFTGGGPRTWQARLYIGAELQHPVLRIFNPTIGVGLSLIGNPDPGVAGALPPGPTFLTSVVAGVRIADPRPGGAGGPYLSLFGGPALAVPTVSGKLGLGAEAGAGIGYRWRWLDVSVGAGLVHDPTREPGRQNLVPLGAQLTFTPGQF